MTFCTESLFWNWLTTHHMSSLEWTCRIKKINGLTPRLGARLPVSPVSWRPGFLSARFPGFGTEAFLSSFLVPAEQLWARDPCLDEHIFRVFRRRSIESNNSRPWETTISRNSCFMKDENMLKVSFCTEFLGARAVIRTKQAVLSLFCGRYSS